MDEDMYVVSHAPNLNGGGVRVDYSAGISEFLYGFHILGERTFEEMDEQSKDITETFDLE